MAERIDPEAIGAMRTVISSAALKNKPLPHISELVENFIADMGGIKGLSKAMAEDFKEAKPGSMTRLRMYDLIAHAWKFSHQTDGVKEDFGMMSEEDLENEVAEVMAKYAK